MHRAGPNPRPTGANPTSEPVEPAFGLVASSSTYLPLVFVLLCGIALSIIAFSAVQAWERHMSVEMTQAEFRNRLEDRVAALHRELGQGLDAARELSAFLQVTGSVGQLRPYALHVLSHHPAVQLLGWVPRLAPGERIEALAPLAAGATISAYNADGRLLPAAPDRTRFPLLVLAAYSEHAPVNGFDLESAEPFREAMARAARSGEMVLTAPLPQKGRRWPGFDVATLMPVYRGGGIPPTEVERQERLEGFVLAGYRMGKLMARAQSGTDARGVDLWIRDETDPGAKRTLYYPQLDRVRSLPAAQAEVVESTTLPIAIGGRTWVLTAVPDGDSFHSPPAVSGWIVLGSGLAVTLLLFWYMAALRRQTGDMVTVNQALSREIEDHRRTEEALRGSESRLRKILETAGDAILISDKSGCITVANQRAQELFGYPLRELLGMPVNRLVPEPCQAAHREHERHFLESADRHTMAAGRELEARRRDGSTVPVEINLSPLRTPEGLFVTAIVRDVTERRQARERLQWLARLPAENPNPLLRLEGEGRIVYANDASQPLLQAWAVRIGEPPPEPFYGVAAEVLQAERARDVELNADGRTYRLTFSPAPNHVNIYGLDITERREAEQTRERLSAILEATTDFAGIAEADSERLVYVNAAGRAMVGLAPDASLATSCIDDHVAEESRERLRREVLPRATENGLWSGELSLAGADGSTVPVSAVVLAHYDGDGRAAYFSALARDITESKRTERHLRRINRTHEVLSACNQALVGAVSENELMRTFCRKLVEVGGYRFAWVGFVSEATPEVKPACEAGEGGAYLAAVTITRDDTPTGRGPVGTALRTGEPAIVRDIRSDPSFAPWAQAAAGEGFRSLASLPLESGQQPFGTLTIYAAETDAFDADEVELLRELARDLAYGIRTIRAGEARIAAETGLLIRNRALEVSRNGIVIAAAAGADRFPITYVNPAFEKMTGYSPRDAIGRDIGFLDVHEMDRAERKRVRSAMLNRRDGHAVVRTYRKDGSLFWNELFVAPVYDEGEAPTHFVAILNDVTEHKRYEEELEYQAQHDELTGLPNRNLLQDRIDQALVYASRYGRAVAVLFLDVDQFKMINDALGHRIGDEFLRVMGLRLIACGRQGDTVARYGGDEFVVLLSDLGRVEDVNLVAERILQSFAEPVEVDGHRLQTTVSIGATIFPRDGGDSATLLKNADTAMYRAKELGRNSIHFYTEDLNQRLVERLALERQLRQAIESEELVLHYQPQVDLRSGRITGLEALVRWEHPELGLVSPGRFIPLAEETGLIVPLGDWVIRTACRQNRSWQAAGLPPVSVAVNLSARQLGREGLFSAIAGILEETGLEPHCLELELTESSVMDDTVEMLARLRRLKELGVQLSIDDFGTGYSSLGQLKRFPFDKLKIDQSFVRDVTTDPDDAAIAVTIIGMAQTLNLRVIAEGVESEGQLRYLMGHGCDAVQGYLFSRPVPADAAERLLREQPDFDLPAIGGLEKTPVLVVSDGSALMERLVGTDRRCRPVAAADAESAFDRLARHDVQVLVLDMAMAAVMDLPGFLRRVGELHPGVARLAVTDRQQTLPPELVERVLYRPGVSALRQAVRELCSPHEVSRLA